MKQRPRPRKRPLLGILVLVALVLVLGVLASFLGRGTRPGLAPLPDVAGRPTGTAPRPSSATVLGTTEVLPARLIVNPSSAGRGSGTNSDPFVSTVDAVLAAKPGDTIVLKPGQYPELTIRGFAGTSAKPLRIEAEPGVTVSAGGVGLGAGVLIEDSSHVWIRGFSVNNSLWGVNVNRSSNVHIENVTVSQVGQEGMIIHGDSSFVWIDRSTISNTGTRQGVAQFGEGIYIGTGSDSIQDRTHDVTVSRSSISNTTAEAIDIKAFAYNITIDNNQIRDIDTHNSGAVVVGIGNYDYPDPNVIISNNLISRVRSNPSPWFDANCIVISAPATVVNNVVSDCGDRGIFVDNLMPNPQYRSVNLWHNTVFSNGRFGDIVTDGTADLDARNNIGLDAVWNIPSGPELFDDPGNPQLGLREDISNPAIDGGDKIQAVSLDRLGNRRSQGGAPDLGAYETSLTARPTANRVVPEEVASAADPTVSSTTTTGTSKPISPTSTTIPGGSETTSRGLTTTSSGSPTTGAGSAGSGDEPDLALSPRSTVSLAESPDRPQTTSSERSSRTTSPEQAADTARSLPPELAEGTSGTDSNGGRSLASTSTVPGQLAYVETEEELTGTRSRLRLPLIVLVIGIGAAAVAVRRLRPMP